MMQMEKDGHMSNELPATLQQMKVPADMQSCPQSKKPYVYDPAAGTVACVTPGHEKL
jgi:hypothetical protein